MDFESDALRRALACSRPRTRLDLDRNFQSDKEDSDKETIRQISSPTHGAPRLSVKRIIKLRDDCTFTIVKTQWRAAQAADSTSPTN